jgi:hypothetical protein
MGLPAVGVIEDVSSERLRFPFKNSISLNYSIEYDDLGAVSFFRGATSQLLNDSIYLYFGRLVQENG